MSWLLIAGLAWAAVAVAVSLVVVRSIHVADVREEADAATELTRRLPAQDITAQRVESTAVDISSVHAAGREEMPAQLPVAPSWVVREQRHRASRGPVTRSRRRFTGSR